MRFFDAIIKAQIKLPKTIELDIIPSPRGPTEKISCAKIGNTNVRGIASIIVTNDRTID